MKTKLPALQKLVISLMIVSVLISSSGKAYAVPYDAYKQFSDNVNSGRFVTNESQTIVSGDFHSASDVIDVITWIIFIYAAYKEWQQSRDPQHVLLLDSFEINGQNIFNNLIAEAKLPSNRAFESYMPNFLGGCNFIGSNAFSGDPLDKNGNAVENAKIGFGVFESDSQGTFFAPITFIKDIADIATIDSVRWDLSPVSFSGSYLATGKSMVSFDATVPEPASFRLFGLGLVVSLILGRLLKKRTRLE